MASLIYDSYWDDVGKGNIVPNTDTFYGMLVASGYTPNKGTHAKRSDVTSEATGTGYTTGGQAVTCTLSLDTTNHRSDLTLTAVNWSSTSTSAAGLVLYKHRGGASSADNLVAFIDFGGTVTSTGGTFAVTFSSPLRIQN